MLAQKWADGTRKWRAPTCRALLRPLVDFKGASLLSSSVVPLASLVRSGLVSCNFLWAARQILSMQIFARTPMGVSRYWNKSISDFCMKLCVAEWTTSRFQRKPRELPQLIAIRLVSKGRSPMLLKWRTSALMAHLNGTLFVGKIPIFHRNWWDCSCMDN